MGGGGALPSSRAPRRVTTRTGGRVAGCAGPRAPTPESGAPGAISRHRIELQRCPGDDRRSSPQGRREEGGGEGNWARRRSQGGAACRCALPPALGQPSRCATRGRAICTCRRRFQARGATRMRGGQRARGGAARTSKSVAPRPSAGTGAGERRRGAATLPAVAAASRSPLWPATPPSAFQPVGLASPPFAATSPPPLLPSFPSPRLLGATTLTRRQPDRPAKRAEKNRGASGPVRRRRRRLAGGARGEGRGDARAAARCAAPRPSLRSSRKVGGWG